MLYAGSGGVELEDSVPCWNLGESKKECIGYEWIATAVQLSPQEAKEEAGL